MAEDEEDCKLNARREDEVDSKVVEGGLDCQLIDEGLIDNQLDQIIEEKSTVNGEAVEVFCEEVMAPEGNLPEGCASLDEEEVHDGVQEVVVHGEDVLVDNLDGYEDSMIVVQIPVVETETEVVLEQQPAVEEVVTCEIGQEYCVDQENRVEEEVKTCGIDDVRVENDDEVIVPPPPQALRMSNGSVGVGGASDTDSSESYSNVASDDSSANLNCGRKRRKFGKFKFLASDPGVGATTQPLGVNEDQVVLATPLSSDCLSDSNCSVETSAARKQEREGRNLFDKMIGTAAILVNGVCSDEGSSKEESSSMTQSVCSSPGAGKKPVGESETGSEVQPALAVPPPQRGKRKKKVVQANLNNDSGGKESGDPPVRRRSNRIRSIEERKEREREERLKKGKPVTANHVTAKPSEEDSMSLTSSTPTEDDDKALSSASLDGEERLTATPVDDPLRPTATGSGGNSGKESPQQANAAVHPDEAFSRPEKVKSRWRRSSELERAESKSTVPCSTAVSPNFATPGGFVNGARDTCYASDGPYPLMIYFDQHTGAEYSTAPDGDGRPVGKEVSPTTTAAAAKTTTVSAVAAATTTGKSVGSKEAAVDEVALTATVKEETTTSHQMPRFDQIAENIYLCERKRSKSKKEVRRMICDCIISKEEVENGMTACGDDCLNRLLMIECGSRCPTGEYCTNKRFQKRSYVNIEPFKTEMKGWGLRALEDLPGGSFVMEYVGEVLDPREFRKRTKEYAREKYQHYYFMALKSDEIIDATRMGNTSRFINHSCSPNCETQKWTVNGELRIGFFTSTFVRAGEELTFDYQFQRYGKEAQRCYCQTDACRGFIGGDKQISLKKERRETTTTTTTTTTTASTAVLVMPRRRKTPEERKRESLEDMDLEQEVEKLSQRGGLRNRDQTLTLSRLMVRAEDSDLRLALLRVLRQTTEQACLRLFLDYHGLSLLWSWMVDVSNGDETLALKTQILQTLQLLPVANKTMLMDSRVMAVVQRWADQISTTNHQNATINRVSTEIPSVVEEPVGVDEFQQPKDENVKEMVVDEEELKSVIKEENPNDGDVVVGDGHVIIKEEVVDEQKVADSPVHGFTEIGGDEAMAVEPAQVVEDCRPIALDAVTLESGSKDVELSLEEPSPDVDRCVEPVEEIEMEVLTKDGEEEVNIATEDLGPPTLVSVLDMEPMEVVVEYPAPIESYLEEEVVAYEVDVVQEEVTDEKVMEEMPVVKVEEDEEVAGTKSEEVAGTKSEEAFPDSDQMELKEVKIEQVQPEVVADSNVDLAGSVSGGGETPPEGGRSSVTAVSSDPNSSATSIEEDKGVFLANLAAQLLDSWSCLKEAYRIPKRMLNQTRREHEREADRHSQERDRIDDDDQSRTGSEYDRKRAAPSTSPDRDYSRYVREKRSFEGDPSPELKVKKRLRSAICVSPGYQAISRLTKEERRHLFELKVQQEEAEEAMRKQHEEYMRQQHEAEAAAVAAEAEAAAAAAAAAEAQAMMALGGDPGAAIFYDPGYPPPFYGPPPPVAFVPPPGPVVVPISSEPPVPGEEDLPVVDGNGQPFVDPTQPVAYPPPGIVYPQPPYLSPVTGPPGPVPPPYVGPRPPIYYPLVSPGEEATSPGGTPMTIIHIPAGEDAMNPGLTQWPESHLVPLMEVTEEEDDEEEEEEDIEEEEEISLPTAKPRPLRLPPNWKTASDPQGRVYYYHSVTRQTQWDPPSWDDVDEEDLDIGTPTIDEPTKSKKKSTTTSAAADTSSELVKRLKEQFRTKMSQFIVQCLNPHRKPDCKAGRITSTDDFKHLARKLTHFIMAKELKHCRSIEDLECNDNVKHKAKDFVRKYMTKFGSVYRKTSSPREDD